MCALETRDSIGGAEEGEPRPLTTAGGAAELRKPTERGKEREGERDCQDSSSSLRTLKNGTASSAARHEGLHPT